jgi:hypothetical protein
MSCTQREVVERLELGAVAEAELSAFREHARGCAECGASMEELTYLKRLLVGTFREVEAELRPQRELVEARLGDSPCDLAPHVVGARTSASRQPESRTAGGRAFSRRWRRWFLAVNAAAAGLLLVLYAGYASVIQVKQEVLARSTRIEVKNLALALRNQADASAAGLPASGAEAIVVALSRPGRAGALPPLAALPTERISGALLLDGYGRPFSYARLDARSARIYSWGPNRRDDGGGDDDVVAFVVLSQ